MHRRLALIVPFLVCLGLPLSALDAPQSAPVLTVSGAVPLTNDGDLAVFDRAMLRDLDWQSVETTTPFTEGVQRFSGPTLVSLLDSMGVTQGTMKFTALNDYSILIPVSDAREHDVLLAMEHDGRTMRPRDKGPIWVIYPLDDGEDLPDALSARMIWQLNRIEVQE